MYQKVKQDYINRVVWHNRNVADLMMLLEMNRDKLPFDIPEWELMRRGLQHDLDKFETNYANVIVSLYVDNITDEEEIKKRHANCHDHHLINPHHIKYHVVNNIPFSDLDICEMACDAVSSTRKPRFKKYREYPTFLEGFKHWDLDPVLEEYREKLAIIYEFFDSLHLTDDFFGKYPE